MRILHTSDWHLGRTFHGRVLDDAHAAFADHLVSLVREERVDAVLVSGDVYDRGIPPAQSVRLLDETLRRLTEHCRVVLTPGNHDSAQRLGFASGLLREGLVIQARADAVGRGLLLPGDDGGPGAVVYALPYLDPDAARVSLPPVLARELGEELDGGLLARSHEAVVSGALRLVAADLEHQRHGAGERLPAVVMAHAFVGRASSGGQAEGDGPLTTQSELDIRVGGVDLVPSEVFATLGGSHLAGRSGGLDYVALGHLHRPQEISLPEAVREREEAAGHHLPLLRYSGSPLPFSFTEAPFAKSSVLLEVGPGGVTRSELIQAPLPHRIETVRGTLAELLSPAFDHAVGAWVRVELTGTLPHDATARLKERFPDMLALTRVVEQAPGRERVVVTRASDPMRVADQFLAEAGGGEPTAEERAVLREAYEAVLAAERSM